MQALSVRHARHRFTLVDTLIYAVIGLFTFACIVPFWYVLVSSVSRTPSFLIQDFSLDAYTYIFSTDTLPRSMRNSLYITFFGTLLKLLITSMMAYSLSDTELPGRSVILNLVIFTMLFGGGMIPTYFVVRQTGLLGSLWSLVIPSLVSPFNLIVMKNFFQNIPRELKESARIDGAGEVRILLRIIAPLSVATLATFGLFYAVGLWNTYMSALMYIPDSSKWPVQVLLRNIVYVQSNIGDAEAIETSAQTISTAVKSAVVVASTVPILLIYPFLQKYFAKGMLVGAVKG